MDKPKFCITSDETRAVLGEFTKKEKKILATLSKRVSCQCMLDWKNYYSCKYGYTDEYIDEHIDEYTYKYIGGYRAYILDEYIGASDKLFTLVTNMTGGKYISVMNQRVGSEDSLNRFITFINDSLVGKDKLFNYYPYGWAGGAHIFFNYGNVCQWIYWCDEIEISNDEMSVVYKLQNVLDTLVLPRVLSFRGDELFDNYLDYTKYNSDYLSYEEFIGITLGLRDKYESDWGWHYKPFDEKMLLKAKINCILGSFDMGVSKLWETYEYTEDYIRKLALLPENDIKEEFNNLFKSCNPCTDIVHIDGKLTIVNNVDIYKTVLPKEVLDCLDIKETKKEREFER